MKSRYHEAEIALSEWQPMAGDSDVAVFTLPRVRREIARLAGWQA